MFLETFIFLKKASNKKMKFSIKDFLSNCDQIRRKLRIWSHLQKKFLMENVIFCAMGNNKMWGCCWIFSIGLVLVIIFLVTAG